ncbi:MAG: biopolymer transporter ExbD [Myxococcota bacterium]|nr:biopolymer transporter ExbD [Deltaproteobacteria bacterium]MDQ3339046.1 biopolymer transporter ExbD [Myxococcota bacterium]
MAHIDTGDHKKSRNIDLNIIPFIDLMSCLTAFLLVTAVWVNISQLPISPTGRARDVPECTEGCEDPKLSVLMDADQIWIGISRVNEFESIPKVNGQYDWQKLEDRLKAQKASSFFLDKTNIEIAAQSTQASPVTYQNLVAAMDVAVKVGFADVGLTEPQGLSARPTL